MHRSINKDFQVLSAFAFWKALRIRDHVASSATTAKSVIANFLMVERRKIQKKKQKTTRVNCRGFSCIIPSVNFLRPLRSVGKSLGIGYEHDGQSGFFIRVGSNFIRLLEYFLHSPEMWTFIFLSPDHQKELILLSFFLSFMYVKKNMILKSNMTVKKILSYQIHTKISCTYPLFSSEKIIFYSQFCILSYDANILLEKLSKTSQFIWSGFSFILIFSSFFFFLTRASIYHKEQKKF